MIHKKIRPTGGLLQSASAKLTDHQKSSAMDIHSAAAKPRPSGLRQSHSVADMSRGSNMADESRGPAIQSGTSPMNQSSMSWAPKSPPALRMSPQSPDGLSMGSPESPESLESPSPSRSFGGLRGAMSAAALGMTEEEMASSASVRRSRSRRSSLVGLNEEDMGERMLQGFTFAKQLGVGLTGSVYKAWRKVDVGGRRSSRRVNMMAKMDDEKDGKFAAVAVKVMDKAKILEINETAHVVQESKIMKSVSKHPFIISMLESFQTPSAMFIVMEYAAGRDMFFMIHERGTLTLFQTRAYITQVTLALDHVHSKGFIYRDLKPENLLIRDDGYLRLTDFGFAKALKPGERAYTVCGTPDYLAPETLRQQGCNRAADFWAIGVLLFEMMTGYPPFHGQTHSDLYRRITAGRMRSFPRQFDEDAADLVKRLLKQSEGERIGVGAEGIQKIRRHPFFKGFSWTSVLEQSLEMTRPDVAPDADKGPEDVKAPVKVECLEQPCHLSLAEQELFKAF
jgi:serine/threonine protein kinase